MASFSLPPELSREILEQTVVTVGLRQAVKLRLICKKWDLEVQMAICATRLLETSRMPLSRSLKYNSFFVVEHVFRSVMRSPSSKNDFVATVHETVNSLLRGDSQLSMNLREQYIRILCEAALRQIDVWRLLHYLQTPDIMEENTELLGRNKFLSESSIGGAAVLGDLTFFEKVLKYKVLDSTSSLYFGDPLKCAAENGHYDIARLLLDGGFDLSRSKGNGSALQMAARAGELEIVRLLLSPKYNCPRTGYAYDESVVDAAAYGHIRVLRLLTEHGEFPSTSCIYNRILYAGASNGHEEVVCEALRNGADPNCHESDDAREHPLKFATRRGHAKVVRILIEKGAVGVERMEGLQRAASGGYKDTVRVFIECGDDVNFNDCAALYGAASRGQAEMINFLIELGAKPDLIRDERAQGLVNTVARRGYVSVMKILAANGIDVNFPNQRLRLNPMMEAMENGQDHMVKALAELGGAELAPIDECILRATECHTPFGQTFR